jgi:hypothetical protein
MKLRSCMLVAAALALTNVAFAANLEPLIRETQRMSQEGQRLTLVWWMPPAFWETSLNSSSALTPEGREQTLKALEDYMIFGLVRGKTGIGGLTDVSSREDLLKNSRLEVGGSTLQPIAPEDLSAGAQAILAGFKPALARTAGQVGQGMEIVIYPAKKDGKLLVDAKAAGSLKFTLYEQTFTWHLPLASLLPPKVDPKTHEEFPGNYNFNPFTGGKLAAGTAR